MGGKVRYGIDKPPTILADPGQVRSIVIAGLQIFLQTQVVLPLLESDLLDIMQNVADGTLDKADVRFKNECACCVVMASKGYPKKYETGFEITMPKDKNIYVAGAKLSGEKLLTSGGRVLGVTETAPTLKEAIQKAYDTVKDVKFENAYYRTDIGKKALKGAE